MVDPEGVWGLQTPFKIQTVGIKGRGRRKKSVNVQNIQRRRMHMVRQCVLFTSKRF